ncbi:MAG: tetratricopeptide repeat protein [Anaerolineaceae bacterium]|nr:MAG: tetratricopeptide repeat protein [Anaerolineaceae bacterium]
MARELIDVKSIPLTDAEVLASLSELFSPGELSQVLSRLLRTPEIWLQLHEPGLLEGLDPKETGISITPNRIASLVLDVPSLEKASQSSLGERESRLSQLWEKAKGGSLDGGDCESYALLAIGLLREYRKDQGLKTITRLSLGATEIWRSPLIYAWPEFEQREQILSDLITQGGSEGIALVVDITLANLSPLEAAQSILESAPHASDQIVLVLQAINEQELLQAYVSIEPSDSTRLESLSSSDLIESCLASAIRDLVAGDVANTQEALDSAWEAATHNTGMVADLVADIARAEGDPVVENQARRQALQSHPTPLRRAELGLSLIQHEQSEEALTTLSDKSETVEEQIVIGLALLHLGETIQASEVLRQAAEALSETKELNIRYLNFLIDGLTSLGETEHALQAARTFVQREPNNIEARIQLSTLLEEAGDPHSGSEEAHLALALEPNSKNARYALASNLQASGLPESALPHWQTLAGQDEDVLARMAHCALEAVQIDLARDTANRIIRNDQDSLDGQIILGKVHAAVKEHESARSYFEKAIRIAPQNPEAWIGLAECQAAVGENQEAGTTLSAGTQASPNSGHLHYEYSRWLRDQGRLNDALEEIKQATSLNRKQAHWLVEYGDLLNELGHNNDALSVLQEAYAIQPENWDTRQALAHLFEQFDDIEEASRLMLSLPDNAPKDAHLLAGRILAKSIGSEENTTVERVISHFEHARSNGYEDPSIDYWLGLAHENAGQFDEAFLAYQACLKQLPEDDRSIRLQAVLGMARTALATDLISLALSSLEEEHKRYPTSAELLVLLAETYLAAQLPEQALRTSQQAVDLDPTCLDAVRMLIRAAIESGDFKAAIRASQELLTLHPEDVDAWLDLAVISQKADEKSSSRKALAHALRYGRKNPDILQRTADILIDLGEEHAALRMLQRTASLLPEDTAVHQKLAYLSGQLGDLNSAQQAWRRCIELRPDDYLPYCNAAQALWDLNRQSAAIGLWQRAASLQPDDVILQSKLAKAYLDNGEAQRGLEHYKIALELRPDDADLCYEAGIAVLRHGSPDRALNILQNASQLAPGNMAPLIALGECFLALDRPLEAREVLEKAVQGGRPPLRALALLTIAALETGDLSAAKTAFDPASQLTPDSIEDVIWFSRASIYMGAWEQSVSIFDNWLSIEDYPDAVLEYIRARLRIFDASWIYRIASEAINHAPPPELTSDKAKTDVKAWIQNYRSSGSARNAIDGLTFWLRISEGEFEKEPQDMVKTVAKLGPSAEILHAAAIRYLRLDQPDTSLGILRAFREIKDKDSWGAILTGVSHAEMGQHARARHAYQGATNPIAHPIASYHSALAWEADGSVLKAIARLNEALAAWTDEPLWHFKLASLYEGEGELDKALPHFQQAAELLPDEADFQLALARTLREVGQLPDAESIYSKVIKAFPTEGQIWKEAGQVAMATGNAKVAEAWFERACTLSPDDAHSLIGSAHSALALGHHRQAIERAQAALRIAPDDFEVLLGMGKIFAAQGKNEKALDVYDKALDYATNPLDVQLARSKLLIQVGHPEQAEASLRKALDANPDDHRAWAALAEACEAANHFEAGLEASSHAVRYSPRNVSYRLQLGRLARIAGQLDLALDEIAQAQSISPSDHRLALELGKIHEARREDDLSLNAYTQAISLDPNNDEAHYRAGLVLKRLKEYRRAASMIERAVELNPRDPKVLHQLAAVRALELVHGGTLNSAVSS